MSEKWHNYVRCSSCGKEIEIYGNFKKGEKLKTPKHKEYKKDKIYCPSADIVTIYNRLESK